MSKSRKYRFYLPSKKDFFYPNRVRLIEGTGGNKKWNYDTNKPIEKLDPDYVPEAFTGEQAVNGELFVGDIIFYKNANCPVVQEGSFSDPTFGIQHGDTFIPFSEIAEPLEILGDVHLGLFNEDEELPEDIEETSEAIVSSPVSEDINSGTIFKRSSTDEFFPFQQNVSYKDDDEFEEEETIYFEPDEDDETYLGEEFQWDDEVATILEMAYTKNLKTKYDVFIRSVLDRRKGTGAWGVDIKSSATSDDLVINDVYKGKKIEPFIAGIQKKLLELTAFQTVLQEISTPSLIKIHSDNGFLGKFVKDTYIPSAEEEELAQNVKALMKDHQFLIIPESVSNTMVESLIARDAAKDALAMS